MQCFYDDNENSVEKMISDITDTLLEELNEDYPDTLFQDNLTLRKNLNNFYKNSNNKLIFIIDE